MHWLFFFVNDKIDIHVDISGMYSFRYGADFSFSEHYSLFMTKVYNDYKFTCNNFLIYGFIPSNNTRILKIRHVHVNIRWYKL